MPERVKLNPPDWENLNLPNHQFRRLNDLLDEYNREQEKMQGGEARDRYLALCEDEFELDIVTREMDCIDELVRKPLKVIGGYLVGDLIAEGGFGVVSHATGPDGEHVAIKVPHKSWHYAYDRAKLDEEAMILRDLDHPHIVKFIDSGYKDTWYLVTEYIHGYNLTEALQVVRAPLTQWLGFIVQVCDALEFGHRQGVVHRDITPRNIMLTGQGMPIAKLLDYGVAKRELEGVSIHVRGNASYLSPEQMESGRFDERSDIYSLGVVLREVVAAQYLRSHRPPKWVKAIIQRATEKDPKKRYQAAAEFKAALVGAIDQLEAGSLSLIPAPKPRFGLAAAIAVSVVFVVAMFMLNSNQNEPVTKTVIPTPVAKTQPNSEPDNLRPWSEFFNEDGHPRIAITSDPPGAELTAYNLADGLDSDMGIQIGVGPTGDVVPPGDYLITAVWPDGQWTEVLRRIPRPKTQGPGASATSFNRFEQLGKSLVFTTIRKPAFSFDGMIQANNFWADEYSRNPLQRRPNSFAYIAEKLENEGKRLPFKNEVSEMIRCGANPASLEWTGSLAIETDRVIHPESKKPSYYQTNLFFVWGNNRFEPMIEHSVQRISFRGIRNLRPFGR